jgi:hypothetical protein
MYVFNKWKKTQFKSIIKKLSCQLKLENYKDNQKIIKIIQIR